MSKIVAIDPGKNGAAAIRYRDNEIFCYPFPSNRRDLVKIFTEMYKLGADDVAYIEAVSGYIGTAHPGARMFNFGVNYGLLLGVLECCKCKVVNVFPRTWMKGLELGTRGERSKVAWKRHLKSVAAEMWPDVSVTLKNADALLILAYAINEEKTKQKNSSETEAGPQVEEGA